MPWLERDQPIVHHRGPCAGRCFCGHLDPATSTLPFRDPKYYAFRLMLLGEQLHTHHLSLTRPHPSHTLGHGSGEAAANTRS